MGQHVLGREGQSLKMPIQSPRASAFQAVTNSGWQARGAKSLGRVVNVCWIDESDPDYYPANQAQWDQDKAFFITKLDLPIISNNLCVEVDGTPVNPGGIIPLGEPDPIEIPIIQAGWRSATLEQMQANFETARDGLGGLDFVFLHVDVTLSMDLPPASNVKTRVLELETWVAAQYPDAQVAVNLFDTERWLFEIGEFIQYAYDNFLD
ncbi:hypothetical protein LCGC14_2104710 [marine sediment metagenome]|uniref:Uncharacterized protein n=1 Tax=marine sediment metagenome TaxID=412755 RepID=A0A0F9E8U7_9ZZZZ